MTHDEKSSIERSEMRDCEECSVEYTSSERSEMRVYGPIVLERSVASEKMTELCYADKSRSVPGSEREDEITVSHRS